MTLRRKGAVDRAIADLDEAIRLDPLYARAYVERGLAFQDKGDLERAIADHSEAIRREPASASDSNNRANAYDE